MRKSAKPIATPTPPRPRGRPRAAFDPAANAAIGQRIRQARERAGLSQTAAAQAAKITQEYLSEIEAGKKEPSLAVLRRVTTAVGILLPDLLRGELGCEIGEIVPEGE